ncbi:hypothetical protein ACFP1I_13220 [Dyadobacter subterraneus]|uniref:Uncharacterized protein n=1 Tax=Dyadobacter subterraneus TaxID=2773304 RepID=A0ABR9W9P4_9BACT|nr:hypothetical protein [Dyadobacter subterraneus]MBE9462193.1 hypothetical protein [Dyadobacter subterraneus]
MNETEIKSLVYDFYPRNLTSYDEGYYESKEYLLRKQYCSQARSDNKRWEDFKGQFPELKINLFDGQTANYSFLGSVPSYEFAFSIRPEGYPNKWVVISIFVSVIAKYWSYHIADIFLDKQPEIRYNLVYKEEKDCILKTGNLIEINFLEYQMLTPDIHQMVIDDIATDFTESPTIFQALFY